MDFDPLILSRIQFGFTIAFHIMFPAFTIGLASWLAVLEGLWLKTGNDKYHVLYRFWVKIFAVSFAMGVVSGIVMSYQFGTNWSRLSATAGNVLGPVMTYEVVTAFFLEASFLGIMLFGWDRVGKGLHFAATLMVALGTVLSMFWIIAANSWMQTPAGFVLRDGIFYPVDWWQIVFNPSFPYRLAHMAIGAYLTTCFVIGGVSAWYLRRDRVTPLARTSFAMAIGFAAVVAPLQIIAGDLQGLQVLTRQPAKLAAMEAHWETRNRVPLILFALPDGAQETNHYEVSVPLLGSLILTHGLTEEVRGLKTFAPEDRPPVAIVFWAFRFMVAIGFLMAFIGLFGAYLMWRRRLYTTRWFLRLCNWSLPIGFIAVISGWVTAEVGRQPYVVYGLVRTADAVSPVAGGSVAASLATFILVYGIIFGAGTYYIVRLIQRGPDMPAPLPDRTTKRPKRPLSVPDVSIGAAE